MSYIKRVLKSIFQELFKYVSLNPIAQSLIKLLAIMLYNLFISLFIIIRNRYL